MPAPNPLDRLVGWFRWARRSLDLTGRITITTTETAYGERTGIRVDHRLPHPGTGRRARWHIVTRKQLLPKAHFDEGVRAEINRASTERGRRLYCVDLDNQQVMAALSYHLDDRADWPVLVTALGMRVDEGDHSELFDQSRACAWLLKQYAHAIGEKLGRPASVDIDAPTKPEVLAELELLGFRKAPKLKGFKPSGTHLRQDPI